jgi:hypothetical protein
MMRALYDGIFRSCHTWGIGERETRVSTWFSMFARVESPVNSTGASGNVRWEKLKSATMLPRQI